MGLFDDILGTARDMALNVSRRAEEFLDVSKIRLEIKDLEKQRDKHYISIGKLYEKTLKSGVDNSKNCLTLISKIEEINKKIIKLKSMIDYKDKDDLSDPIFQSEEYSVYESDEPLKYNDFYKK